MNSAGRLHARSRWASCWPSSCCGKPALPWRAPRSTCCPPPAACCKPWLPMPPCTPRPPLLTLGEALVGLLLGLLAGALLASLLTLQPGLEDGVMTLAILLKSTPMVAHGAAADPVAGFWRAAQDHHHRPADLLPGAGQHPQRPAAARPRPAGPVPLVARLALGDLHQAAPALRAAVSSSPRSRSAPRWPSSARWWPNGRAPPAGWGAPCGWPTPTSTCLSCLPPFSSWLPPAWPPTGAGLG